MSTEAELALLYSKYDPITHLTPKYICKRCSCAVWNRQQHNDYHLEGVTLANQMFNSIQRLFN